MILAGDVGGTKTRLALFASRGPRLVAVREAIFPSRAYKGLAAILKVFLRQERRRITSACFGVAGPVINGRCRGANLPWLIDAAPLRRAFRIGAVHLINDLAATGYGIACLQPSAFATLQRGRPQRHGTIAVLAAGTGLGEAALVWDGRHYRAVASEGGHSDFAPRTELEVALWRHLSGKHGHVSYERILSGPGKFALYRFLRGVRGGAEPRWLTQAFRAGDPSAVVSEMALCRRSRVCLEALDVFVSVYGAEAGNLALKWLARGGVYIGGGIAPTILPLLRDGTFMKAFRDKGRLSPLLAQIPVRVILDDRAALYGAVHYAAGVVG